ncbi:Copia protein [Vitis vinifera]|uniref:Copia protein n=1 Tax=Vitis vinifera TaxID=29760 RepID=A0A438FXU3_VITVI|nr:Copia protein [Vitis vinifera]
MEDTDIEDLFLIDLPPSMSKPSQSQSFVSKSEHSQSSKPTSTNPRSPPSGKQVPSSTRPTLVYLRKKATIIELVQVQELELTTSCKEWKQAMRTEMEVLEKNGNWNVVELPREKSPVGCKWVFTETRKPGCKPTYMPIDPNHKLREESEDAIIDKGSVVDRRSTIAYYTFDGGNLTTWRSKKQNIVAKSCTKAKFHAMAQGICALLWHKIILEDLKIMWETPMRLYCGNKLAINIRHNSVQYDRTKHV